MTKKTFLFFGAIMLLLNLQAQDYLTVPSSNPALFRTQTVQSFGEKSEVIEDNFVYLYDTLNLPFIDDFSRDRLRKKIQDTSNSRLTDSLFFKIRIGAAPYRGATGFSTDSTFKYIVNQFGDTITREGNFSIPIQLADLDVFPITYSTMTVFPGFNYTEQAGVKKDTVLVTDAIEQDSVFRYIVASNGTDLWTDRSVYLNRTFGLNPPSIGVVTFDGLGEDGLAYDIDNPIRIIADYLTSVPLRLENLPDTDIYLSFFYQPKGLSIDKPEREDSLVVEFYNVDRDRWTGVWNTIGFDADTFSQAVIEVPLELQKDGFRFRFKNYANSAGAFDQWHVDYVYLNSGRDSSIPVFNDIAYIYDAPSMLKDYYAMPFWHYKNNPQSYMADTAFTFVKNASNRNLQVFNFVRVPDTTTGSEFYAFPASPNSSVRFPADTIINFRYPTPFEFPAVKIDTAGTFQSIFDIQFRPRTDFIQSNDTVISHTVLEDYYAYDDGTAEAGYGVNPALSTDGLTGYMAVKYNIPFKDTLKGIQTYFLPQSVDITKQQLFLTVWSSVNPTTILYQRAVNATAVYSEPNGIVTYSLDSALIVDTTFYVGFKQVGANSMNVGYDLNTNHKNKIFFSQDGATWSTPSNGIKDGALMIRPVFRNRVFDVGVEEPTLTQNDLSVYPNPTTGNVFIRLNSDVQMEQIQILDLTGKLVLDTPFQNQLDLTQFSKGIYFLRIRSKQGQQITKKVIISH